MHADAPHVADPLLSLRDVTVALREGARTMVSGVSFSVGRGEIFGIVGESGSGKTMLTRTLFGLHDDAVVADGRVSFDGKDIPVAGYQRHMRRLLGRRIGLIAQDPYASLNPAMRVGMQIAEALYLGRGIPMRSARARQIAIELLRDVGINEAERAVDQYPDQFSGGMRQRIVIAMALSQEPQLLIADEPTTALDAITQRRIVDLIVERSRTRGVSVILISHNLELLRQSVDRVAVLYGGQLLNLLPAAEIGTRPAHPYTEALLACMPGRVRRVEDIRAIPGDPVGAGAGRIGCAFAPRCAHAVPACATAPLPLNDGLAGRFSACLLGMGA